LPSPNYIYTETSTPEKNYSRRTSRPQQVEGRRGLLSCTDFWHQHQKRHIQWKLKSHPITDHNFSPRRHELGILSHFLRFFLFLHLGTSHLFIDYELGKFFSFNLNLTTHSCQFAANKANHNSSNQNHSTVDFCAETGIFLIDYCPDCSRDTFSFVFMAKAKFNALQGCSKVEEPASEKLVLGHLG